MTATLPLFDLDEILGSPAKCRDGEGGGSATRAYWTETATCAGCGLASDRYYLLAHHGSGRGLSSSGLCDSQELRLNHILSWLYRRHGRPVSAGLSFSPPAHVRELRALLDRARLDDGLTTAPVPECRIAAAFARFGITEEQALKAGAE